MKRELHQYIEEELIYAQSLREEFSRRPELKQHLDRLGLDPASRFRDPFVDWLIEGFAQLCARVRMRLDAGFPKFTQTLLSIVHPELSSPTPSMMIVGFTPDIDDPNLLQGPKIRRDTTIRIPVKRDRNEEPMHCEFRTGHDVTLWPIAISAARTLPARNDIVQAWRGMPRVACPDRAQCGIELLLRPGTDLPFPADLDQLDLHFQGAGETAWQLFRLAGAASARVWAMPVGPDGRILEPAQEVGLKPLGLEPAERLLPLSNRLSDGFRTLREFLACPERLHFVQVSGLRKAATQVAAGLPGTTLRLLILSERPGLAFTTSQNVQQNIKLFATPAVNLFPRDFDNLSIDRPRAEYQLVVDHSRPASFEVHSVERVVALDAYGQETPFRPFFEISRPAAGDTPGRFYALRREDRRRAETASGDRRTGGKGSELFISLLDEQQVPFATGLKQISIRGLCTNRFLSEHQGVEEGRPIEVDADIAVPPPVIYRQATTPRPGVTDGPTLWRLLNHLSFNYLAVSGAGDDTEARAAETLRDVALVHLDAASAMQPVVGALKGVRCMPEVSRLPVGKDRRTPIVFGRGLRVDLNFEDLGPRIFPLALVLERLLAGVASANSFTQVNWVCNQERQEKWPPRAGLRKTL